jgi:hypothetical protein
VISADVPRARGASRELGKQRFDRRRRAREGRSCGSVARRSAGGDIAGNAAVRRPGRPYGLVHWRVSHQIAERRGPAAARLETSQHLLFHSPSVCSIWGVSRNWWDVTGTDMTGQEMLTWGPSMRWVLRLIETGMPSGVSGVDVMEISRPDGASNRADLGLTLSEAKQLLACVQQAIVAAQAGDLAARRPECSSCSGRCHVNGRRCHLLATPFGKVTVQLPRFRCVSCGHIERCVTWPSHCRSTPELDRLRAHLSALMPFRVAADVLTHLLPADVGMSPETLRAHTLKIGEQLGDIPTAKPVAAAMSITVTTDSTFIRSCEAGNRHLEVRVGNVETSDGGRQVFGAVARSNTDIAVQIRRSLEAVGGTAATKVTAFTDGCPGLRSILADAGVTTRPIADWFHIAMRLQHAKLAASGLLTDEPGRKEAKATIVTEVERLHWRIWNGKAKNAQKTFDRIRKVMHLYKGERGHRTRGVASRKLWHALHEIDKYLRSQSTRLVNYAARYRAGMRVGTAVTEGTANFLVNRRMNKSQQRRWSRRGANLVLQVRCAVYNGTLGSGFGQRFDPIGRPDVTVKIAA